MDPNGKSLIAAFMLLLTALNNIRLCFCASVKFYSVVNYTGFLGEVDIKELDQRRCVSVAEDGTGLQVRSVKADRCIILYNHPDCRTGFTYPNPKVHPFNYLKVDKQFVGKVSAPLPSFRIDQSEADLGKLNSGRAPYVYSFHVCGNELGGGSEVNVDIYTMLDLPSHLNTYSNVCLCTNLPSGYGNFYLDNHGNGLDLFENENCQGRSKYLRPGVSLNSFDLWEDGSVRPSMFASLSERTPDPDGILTSFDSSEELLRWGNNRYDFKSFRPSGRARCTHLHATIYKFQFGKDTNPKKVDDNRHVHSIKSKNDETIVKNGSGKIVHEHTMSDRLSMALQFSVATPFTQMYSVEVDREYDISMAADVPLFISSHVKQLLAEQYSYVKSNATEIGPKIVVDERDTSSKQTIEIPPYQKCTISSLLKMLRNFPIEYTAYAYVRGFGGKGSLTADEPINANELKEYLPHGMEYIQEYDESTGEVAVNGTMYITGVNEAVVNVVCESTECCTVNF